MLGRQNCMSQLSMFYVEPEEKSEYLLILSFKGTAVERETYKLKKDCTLRFPTHRDDGTLIEHEKSVPHITIKDFVGGSKKERKKIINYKILAARLKPLKVSLNRIGGFEKGDRSTVCIFVNETDLETKNFIEQVKKDKLHITIARQLPLQIYQLVHKHYSNQKFEYSFVADRFVLLRRQPGGTFENIAEFPFGNSHK